MEQKQPELLVQADFWFSKSLLAQNALQALEPELQSAHEKRARTTLVSKNRVLSVQIKALDLKALNASLFSVFNHLALVQKIQGLKKE